MSRSGPCFDADNHYYETRDAFTRHMEPRLRDKAIHFRTDASGRDILMIGERPFTFLENLFQDRVAPPGMLREMLRNLDGASEAPDIREPLRPEYVERAARLACMDRQGLQSALMFPTIGVCVEHFMKHDAEQTWANLRAFNRWLEEDWGFAHQGRIFAAPLLSLLDLDQAVAELDWALARGARVVHLRPGPAFGRSPADPYFDPLWSRIDEARVAVAFHIGESSYNELISVHWGQEANAPSHRQSALQWACFYGDRPILDTVAALILGNLFGRFPNIRILSVENGSLWVGYGMKLMDKMKGMARNGPWPGGYVKGRPSEILKRHVFVSPYHEEDIPGLARLIGPSQVLFGSDWPHPEGMAEPAAFAAELEGLSTAEIAQIMHGNTARLVAGHA